MSDFPVIIEMMSRFKIHHPSKEKLLKQQLMEVLMLIGTHRLLSADVSYKESGASDN